MFVFVKHVYRKVWRYTYRCTCTKSLKEKRAIGSRKSKQKERQYNVQMKKEKQIHTKHYTENKRMRYRYRFSGWSLKTLIWYKFKTMCIYMWYSMSMSDQIYIFWLITIFTQKHSQLIYKFIFFSLHLTKINTEYNKITSYIHDQLHFLNYIKTK